MLTPICSFPRPPTVHDKSTVIQEARCFNESPISPRKCRSLLARIVYLLYCGETFSVQEATQLFFGVTKLFQHKDVSVCGAGAEIEQARGREGGEADRGRRVRSSLPRWLAGREERTPHLRRASHPFPSFSGSLALPQLAKHASGFGSGFG